MNLLEWCIVHKAALIIAAVVVAVLIIIIFIAVRIHKRKHPTPKELYKFLRYKFYEGPPENKQQHPKLIVEVTADEYGFMGLTKSPAHGKTKNLPIKNPKKGDKKESYIRKEVRHTKKENFFDEILKKYKLSRKDKKTIINYLKNRKKK